MSVPTTEQKRLWLKMHSDSATRHKNAGDLHRALEEYSAILDVFRSAVFSHQRALIFYMMGSYSEAISDLDNAISINPADPDHFINRGNAFLKLDKLEQARQDFRQALALCPNNEHSIRGLSVIDRRCEDNKNQG